MNHYNIYIATKRFSGTGICGEVIIPTGTELAASNGFIQCTKGPLCAVVSQNAYEHFAQNDDGKGMERGELTRNILKRIRNLKKNQERSEHIWGKIWEDPICQKFRRIEHADHWVWNYDFYNGDIEDLKHVRNLIMKG